VTTKALRASALGRIAIRKVSSERCRCSRVRLATVSSKRLARSAGPNRDRVAELVIDALERFAPVCQAAALMVVAWRHRDRVEALLARRLALRGSRSAVEQPGLVPSAIEHNRTERGAADELPAIDFLLLRALGRDDGELVVVPVPNRGQGHLHDRTAVEHGASVAVVEAIAGAASAAFARLVRDASR